MYLFNTDHNTDRRNCHTIKQKTPTTKSTTNATKATRHGISHDAGTNVSPTDTRSIVCRGAGGNCAEVGSGIVSSTI